jgi:hypothetical protein
MSTLTQASHQWATRPDDERFTNLDDLLTHFKRIRDESRGVVVSSKRIQCEPESDNKGLLITGPNGHAYAPTHHAFGQLAQLAQAPAGYMRSLPSPLVADCLNYGLKFQRDVEDVGVLLQRNSSNILRAATGPNYGRVWNSDITQTLVNRFGDGRTGEWRIPGEFGKQVAISKANTTLFASDRDMFVFLADEQNRVTLPGRRADMLGTFARGFFVWNSEVGDKTLGIASFLFDYACCNRIVWGVEGFKKITVRHTVSAPDRWLEEVQPVLTAYAHGSAKPVEQALLAAQAKKIDDVDAFLGARFSKRLVPLFQAAHELEEGGPIETVWDAVTGITAYAKGLAHQDARVALETQAGALIDLVAN